MEANVLGIFAWALMVALGGSSTHELVGVLDPNDYFQSRQIKVTAATMIELASVSPQDGKAQIAQLLAIRWLAEHPVSVQNDKKARETLEKIAQGTVGQDTLGFAKEHAQAALARLDGKPGPRRFVPPDSVRRDGLAGFPADLTFFGGYDLRETEAGPAVDDKPLRDLFNRLVPKQEKEEVYKFAEMVGNIRLDRVSFAVQLDSNAKNRGRIFVRFTGLADSRKLADFVSQSLRGGALKEEKSPNGEPLLVVSAANEPPAIGFIGNHDLIMAGYEANDGNHIELLREALEVMAGKKPGLPSGPRAAQLSGVPPGASGLLMGELPEPMRRDLAREGSPFKSLPQSIILYLVKGKKITIQLQATMANKDAAAAFVENVKLLKQLAIAQLDNLGPAVKLKPETIKPLKTALENLQVEAKDETIFGTLELPGDLVSILKELSEGMLGVGPK